MVRCVYFRSAKYTLESFKSTWHRIFVIQSKREKLHFHKAMIIIKTICKLSNVIKWFSNHQKWCVVEFTYNISLSRNKAMASFFILSQTFWFEVKCETEFHSDCLINMNYNMPFIWNEDSKCNCIVYFT